MTLMEMRMPEAHRSKMSIDAQLETRGVIAQIVRFDIPDPTNTVHAVGRDYHVNMCLTPVRCNRAAAIASDGDRTDWNGWATSSCCRRARNSTSKAARGGRHR
ncbi:hypothetical protein ACFSLT_14100 [Novosphingobium resinovorum]